MKPKIFSAIFLSIALITSSFALKPKPVPATREIAIMAPFQKITVSEYINVVLVQDPYRLTITVTGDEKAVPGVQAKIVKNQLYISSKRSSQGRKITVYVPVEDISLIELSTGCSISGEGILKFKDVTVVLSSESHAALNVLGAITIKPGDDCDFVYEKDEKYKLIPVIIEKKNEQYELIPASL